MNGEAEVELTPFQKVCAIAYVELPFNVVSTIDVSVESIEKIQARNARHGGTYNKRHIPISASASMAKGACPKYGIISLPTAGGKTAISGIIAYLLLKEHRMAAMVSEHEIKSKGEIVKGPLTMNMARLAIFAVAATTFAHFEQTLRRLIPNFDSTCTVNLWSTVGEERPLSRRR